MFDHGLSMSSILHNGAYFSLKQLFTGEKESFAALSKYVIQSAVLFVMCYPHSGIYNLALGAEEKDHEKKF